MKPIVTHFATPDSKRPELLPIHSSTFVPVAPSAKYSLQPPTVWAPQLLQVPTTPADSSPSFRFHFTIGPSLQG